MAPRTWDEVSSRAGRNDMPYLLGMAQWVTRDLEPADLPRAVAQSWSMAEWPEDAMETAMWLTLFEDAGADAEHHIDETADGEIDVLESAGLPETITLYRGAPPERRYRMSWTASLEQAQWFANRWNAGFTVWTAQVPREFVLAYIAARREEEYVIHPDAWEMVEPVAIEEAA